MPQKNTSERWCRPPRPVLDIRFKDGELPALLQMR